MEGFTGVNDHDPLRSGRTLFLFMDGLRGGAEALINEFMTQTGMVYQLFGGAAADDIAFNETHVFHNAEVLKDAFVCAEVLSAKPFGICLSHGWSTASDAMRVTAATGSVIQELNGVPAWSCYQEFAGHRGDDGHTGDEASFMMRHLIGLASPSGTKLRVPLARHDDGSMTCVGDVPPGSIVNVMTMDENDVLERGRQAIEDQARGHPGRTIAGVLALECAAMQLNFNDSLGDVVRSTREACGGAPIAGCSSYGQLARMEEGFEGMTDASSLVCIIPA